MPGVAAACTQNPCAKVCGAIGLQSVFLPKPISTRIRKHTGKDIFSHNQALIANRIGRISLPDTRPSTLFAS